MSVGHVLTIPTRAQKVARRDTGVIFRRPDRRQLPCNTRLEGLTLVGPIAALRPSCVCKHLGVLSPESCFTIVAREPVVDG